MTRRALALAVLVVLAAVPSQATARGLFGVVSQDVLTASDLARMKRSGVASLRFLIRWREIEPTRGDYDWGAVDHVVGMAEDRGIEPLPVVYGSPAWVAEPEAHPPLDQAADRIAWRGFLKALVERYGPEGAFWRGRENARAIRRWQIGNEPNFRAYWHPRPSSREYAELVALSDRALDNADPRAQLVLAGVAPVKHGVPWWNFLRRLYRVEGIRRHFDAVALHPYARGLRELRYQASLAREIMSRAGDGGTPLAITEIGWASGGLPSPLVLGRRGQARMLERAFQLLAARRRAWRLSDVQWYAWQDSRLVEELCLFCERAGLVGFRGRPKPALRAYARVAR